MNLEKNSHDIHNVQQLHKYQEPNVNYIHMLYKHILTRNDHLLKHYGTLKVR